MSTSPRNYKFVTITGDDWKRAMRTARARENQALKVIREIKNLLMEAKKL